MYTGMTSHFLNRVILFAASTGGLPQSEMTFARILQDNGYKTGLIGKWHLGLSCSKLGDHCHHPNHHGFEYFYGTPMTNFKDSGGDGSSVVNSNFPNYNTYTIAATTLCLALSMGLHCIFGFTKRALLIAILCIIVVVVPWLFVHSLVRLNLFLMTNGHIIEQPIHFPNLTDRIINRSINFIQQASQDPAKPFLLMVNFLKVHTAHFPSDKFRGKSNYGKYGDSVMEMDAAVGRILEALDSAQLRNGTIVYFTSDNGGHIEEVNAKGEPEGGSNGIFPGGKGHGAVEGGIRIPGIISWPGHFPAQTSINTPTSHMDLLPTLMDILNIKHPISGQILDGQSLLPLIMPETGLSNQRPPRILFHYCGTYLHGVRFAESFDKVYKLYFFTPNYDKPAEKKCKFVCQCFGKHVIAHDPPLIYNVQEDPREESPLPYNQTLVDFIAEQVENHQKTLDPQVESQFSISKFIWRPWMQPCCNWPLCSCKEDETASSARVLIPSSSTDGSIAEGDPVTLTK